MFKEQREVRGYAHVVFNDEELVVENGVVFGQKVSAGVGADDVASFAFQGDQHDVFAKQLGLFQPSALRVLRVQFVDAREDQVHLPPLDVVVLLELMVGHGAEVHVVVLIKGFKNKPKHDSIFCEDGQRRAVRQTYSFTKTMLTKPFTTRFMVGAALVFRVVTTTHCWWCTACGSCGIGMTKPWKVAGDNNLMDVFVDTSLFLLGGVHREESGRSMMLQKK